MPTSEQAGNARTAERDRFNEIRPLVALSIQQEHRLDTQAGETSALIIDESYEYVVVRYDTIKSYEYEEE